MFSNLNKNGRAAIICSQGVLFRGNTEEDLSKNMIKEDIIEGIIALPPKLFYGTGIPGCILINRNKNLRTTRTKLF
jgi:type I restriction enzyme M protein